MRTLILACCLWAINQAAEIPVKANGDLNQTRLTYSVELDPKYELQWETTDTELIVRVIANSIGWVGFGISDSGGMFPADVVIASVKNGKFIVSDRHTTAKAQPGVDASQDWKPRSGFEKNGYTVAEMSRNLTNCDSKDRNIVTGTMRVIWAFGNADPSPNGNIRYHGSTQRGAKSLSLLNPTPINMDSSTFPKGTSTFDITMHNYLVPARETTYACRLFNVSGDLGITRKHHILGFKPIVAKKNLNKVHHLVLFFCENQPPAVIIDQNYECDDYAFIYPCYGMHATWIYGGEEFRLPAGMGLPVGGPNDPKWYKLEMHYNNPELISNIYDSSGLRFFYTSTLQTEEVSLLATGSMIDPNVIIPPNVPEWKTSAYCNPACLNETLGPHQRLRAFAALLHAHDTGSKIRILQIRNGEVIRYIHHDETYDPHYQNMVFLDPVVYIEKGDQIVVECVYNTKGRSNITRGGQGRLDEMCIGYLMLASAAQRTICASLEDSTGMAAIINKAWTMDWTKATSRAWLKRQYTNRKYTPMCDFNFWSLETKPTFTPLAAEPDACS